MSAQAQPKCCYIAPGPDRRGCEKPAVWTIQNTTPGADPYDYTEACDAHVRPAHGRRTARRLSPRG